MIEEGYSRWHFDHCVYFKNIENGCRYFAKENFYQILNKLIWIYVSIVFMEKKKRVIFLRVRKEKKIERLEIFHNDVWVQLMYHILVALIIMLFLLMCN
jgi:hypothetical protein